ncbi:unnamed protein product [Litomosoides sigmodontis]|uniref:Uncharacterized protein n=1 Tax=Litomosoides sigmodontis TaxID=42156 RepID=A0A3P6U8D8_LITSI|nr:unnamed protein product [Litomosoides sigmodontis]
MPLGVRGEKGWALAGHRCMAACTAHWLSLCACDRRRKERVVVGRLDNSAEVVDGLLEKEESDRMLDDDDDDASEVFGRLK